MIVDAAGVPVIRAVFAAVLVIGGLPAVVTVGGTCGMFGRLGRGFAAAGCPDRKRMLLHVVEVARGHVVHHVIGAGFGKCFLRRVDAVFLQRRGNHFVLFLPVFPQFKLHASGVVDGSAVLCHRDGKGDRFSGDRFLRREGQRHFHRTGGRRGFFLAAAAGGHQGQRHGQCCYVLLHAECPLFLSCSRRAGSRRRDDRLSPKAGSIADVPPPSPL